MTESTDNKRKPWLIAAAPGMGNVGVIAAGYLIHKLGARPVAELPPSGFFDIEQVEVRGGVTVPPRLPRSIFHHWKSGDAENAGVGKDAREMLILLSESQPSSDTYGLANQILDRAAALGAERVVTIASIASQLHPSRTPQVFGVVTQPDMRSDLERHDVKLLQDGQVGGLNGVLLGAAAKRGLPGVCLMGEIPFFAAGVANPKAAVAVLRALKTLNGAEVDLTELEKHAEAMDQTILNLLDRLKEQAEQGGGPALPLPEEPEEEEEIEPVAETRPPKQSEQKPKEKTLDYPTRQRIERLFDEVRKDKARAVHLKGELDKLGVFEQYEDRFLDLFRRAE